MTTSEIKDILSHPFRDQKDREYWEKKLEEAERKEETARNNEEYFQVMAVYDR